MKPMISLLALAAIFTQSAKACWAMVSLDKLVKQNPVVVVGEIVEIRANAHKANRQSYDVAIIKVDRILKNTLKQKLGDKIELAMPASSRTLRMSTDITHKKGVKAVWILEQRDGKFWATYPGDRQPLEKEAEIKKYILQK